MVSHRDSGTFAPDLTTFWDLSQRLIESTECLVKLFFCLGSCVLELNEGGPEPTSGKMNIQRLVDEVLCRIEAARANLEQNCFEVRLPLCLCNALGMLHDLSCSLRLASHFKVLGILKHGHRHLLGRYFIAAPLNDFT